MILQYEWTLEETLWNQHKLMMGDGGDGDSGGGGEDDGSYDDDLGDVYGGDNRNNYDAETGGDYSGGMSAGDNPSGSGGEDSQGYAPMRGRTGSNVGSVLDLDTGRPEDPVADAIKEAGGITLEEMLETESFDPKAVDVYTGKEDTNVWDETNSHLIPDPKQKAPWERINPFAQLLQLLGVLTLNPGIYGAGIAGKKLADAGKVANQITPYDRITPDMVPGTEQYAERKAREDAMGKGGDGPGDYVGPRGSGAAAAAGPPGDMYGGIGNVIADALFGGGIGGGGAGTGAGGLGVLGARGPGFSGLGAKVPSGSELRRKRSYVIGGNNVIGNRFPKMFGNLR